MVDKNIQERNS